MEADTSWFVCGLKADTSWFVCGLKADTCWFVCGLKADTCWFVCGLKAALPTPVVPPVVLQHAHKGATPLRSSRLLFPFKIFVNCL